MKKKNKYYIIKDKNNNMLYGAFPFTKEGKAHAKRYLKKININNSFEIEEK